MAGYETPAIAASKSLEVDRTKIKHIYTDLSRLSKFAADLQSRINGLGKRDEVLPPSGDKKFAGLSAVTGAAAACGLASIENLSPNLTTRPNRSEIRTPTATAHRSTWPVNCSTRIWVWTSPTSPTEARARPSTT